MLISKNTDIVKIQKENKLNDNNHNRQTELSKNSIL